jgi:hypothetical protein
MRPVAALKKRSGGKHERGLREESVLRYLDTSSALLVIIDDTIDATANGVAPHQPRFERLHQFGDRLDVLHSGVEPQIVRIWMENYWHPVVNSRGHGVRGGRQYRA